MSYHITNKHKGAIDTIVESLSGGLLPSPYKYTIKDDETGETKHSYADNDKELGENIDNGDIH